MNRERFGIPKIRQMTEELHAFDEFLSGFHSAFDSESDESAVFAVAIFVGEIAIRTRLQSRIDDPGNLVVVFKVFSELHRIFTMTLHPQMKCFKTLQKKKRIRWREVRPHVSEIVQSHLENVSNCGITERRIRLERIPEFQSVIARIRIGELGEFSARPVEITAIDNNAGNRVTVTADIFGRAVNNDIRSPLDRTMEDRRQHRIVENERNLSFLSNFRDLFDRENIQLRISNRLAVNQLCIRLQSLFESIGIIAINKSYLDAELAQSKAKRL